MPLKLRAEILPRGTDKHYGTRIQLFDEDGFTVGNELRVWYCASGEYPDGDAAHSHREPEEPYTHDPLGGHYESVADLQVAEFIRDAINNYKGESNATQNNETKDNR